MIELYKHIKSGIGRCLGIMAACTLLGLLMQSCDKDEPEQLAINFNASSIEPMETTMRGIIKEDVHLQNVGFVLYGYITSTGGENTQVFSDQKVTYEGDAWVYSPVQFWFRSPYYHFGAYAPATLNGISVVSNSDHTLTFTMPYWQVLNEDATDLIVATSEGSASDYVSSHNGTVDLNFGHVQTAFEVQLKKKPELENEYILKNLSYSNVPESSGTATYTFNYETVGNSTMSTIALGDKMICSDANAIIGKGTAESPAATFSHLLVPFKSSDSNKVTLSVTYIAGLGAGQTFEYTRQITTDLTAMQAGKKYTLVLTFAGGEEIIPELQIADWSIAKWDDQDIEEIPKYNW